MSANSDLVLDAVHVVIDDAAILTDVSLRVPAGSVTTLVGPSGAGKTTLLRAIAGLVEVTSGRVCLGPEELTHCPVHHRGLGYVFQEPRLLPHLDAADNVALPQRLAGVGSRARRERAAGLLDEVGLGGYADRDVRDLSGGEQQRVALARALAADPPVLLLDEPFAAVDPDRRQTLRDLVRRIHEERHVTTVFVTHDREEAAELGDHVGLLLEGRVVQHGRPEKVFEAPATRAAADFVGANVVPTDVLRRAGIEPSGSWAAVRPEWVDPDPDGALVGTVTDATYLGTATRLTVTLDDGTQLTVRTSATPPPVGEPCRFRVRQVAWLEQDSAETRPATDEEQSP